MMRRRRLATTWVAIAASAGAALFTSAAHADTLRIETVEYGTWPAAVAALQRDRDSESQVIHIVVKVGEGDQLVPCGGYSLALDTAGAEAFVVEHCNPDSAATAVRLVHRRALFDHGDVVARPRAPGIVATRLQTGGAKGGAKVGAESAVSCSADVHPFLRDLETGERVELTPGRYELRAHGEGFSVSPGPHGWRVTAFGGPGAAVDYDVYDSKRGEVVLHDRVTLACSSVQAESAGGDPTRSQGIDSGGLQILGATLVDVRTIPQGVPESDMPRDYGMYKPSPRDRDVDWNGHSFSAELSAGVAVLRLQQLQWSNANGSKDAGSLGVHDAAAPSLGLAGVFERPGIYTSLGGSFALANQNDRTVLHAAAMSTVAAALHFGDVTVFLGPSLHVGTTQVSGVQSGSWEYGSGVELGLGAAAGMRWHLRDDKDRAWIFGFDVNAPIAGPQPWFVTASLGFGDAK
jgi:hypothetical protein